jgi:hypothetical protein
LLYCDMCQPSGIDMWRNISFWTKNLTKILIQYFSKIEVPSVMRIETQGLKNKFFKTQRPKKCLTLVVNLTWFQN